MVKYCSRDCQVAHRPNHKKECKRRAAELFDEELFKDPPERPECPICMLPLPFGDCSVQFNSCCGKLICLGCVHAQKKEDCRNGKALQDCEACPFCRTPPPLEDEEILERLNKCIERNNAISMRQLAECYLEGEMGLQKDLVKAEELFQKAGENGYATAFGRLGDIYFQGLDKDFKKAKHYWQLGAKRGCMDSRHNLAIVESRSDGIRAYKHFLICVKAGYEPSLQNVKLIFEQGFMTEDEYLEALGAYAKKQEDAKSAMRDEALVYMANPSLYSSNS